METIEVDIAGTKVSLPKDVGEKVINWRDQEKAAKRELSEKAGKLEADLQAKEAARVKAEEDKLALEAAKKGEIDQVRALMSRQEREKLDKLGQKYLAKHLLAAVAARKDVADTATDDIVDQLKQRSKYDFDSDSVVIVRPDGSPDVDESGKPVQVDAWLGKWLEKKPHFLRDRTPVGSGAQGGKAATGKTITAESFRTMRPSEAAKFFQDGGTVAG